MAEEEKSPQEQPEKLAFPLTWTKCPHCGSEETLATKLAKELRLPIIPQTGIITIGTAFQNPLLQSLSVPLLQSVLDICTSCGTFYCRYAAVGVAQVQQGQQDMRGLQFPKN